MSLPPSDSLANRGWIRTSLQHFRAVIGFQDQSVGAGQTLTYEIVDMAQIRRDTQLAALVAKYVAHRVFRVMVDGKTDGFHSCHGN